MGARYRGRRTATFGYDGVPGRGLREYPGLAGRQVGGMVGEEQFVDRTHRGRTANDGRRAGEGGPAKQLAYVRGNNRDPHWSPDSKRIAFTSTRGDHSFIGIYEFSRDTIQY